MPRFHVGRPVFIAGACLLTALASPALAQSRKAAANPAAPQTTTTAPPASIIGAPMASSRPIAPLSPQISSTPLTGGSVRGDRLPSPLPQSDSPSQSAQSTAGGGGRTLQDCMSFWDRATHMTKGEWRAACQRSQYRLDNLKIDNLSLGVPKKGKLPARSTRVTQ
jgi:hypothetical protein